jgi:hypothetical protein
MTTAKTKPATAAKVSTKNDTAPSEPSRKAELLV